MESDLSNISIKEVLSKNIWESFVQKQKFTSPFQSWNWACFERSLGNTFETLGMYRKGKLCGLLPVKQVRAKRGKYLHLRHGPIFDFNDKELWRNFFEFIKRKTRNEKLWFVRMSPLIPKNHESRIKNFEFKDSPMHDVDAEIAWALDLSQREEEILNGMRKNTRYYIKRAERDGVEILKTQDPKYLEDFWSIYQDTIKRQRWSAYSKEYITKEFEAFVKDDQVQLFLAKYKGEFIAGALFLYYGNQSVYHHSGSLTKYSRIPASYLIQWESIKEAKRRGLKWFNFWGIAPLEERNGKLLPQRGHPWEGLTFFKLGFGGEKREFIHAKDLPVDWKYNFTRMFELIERKRRGY